MKTKKDKIFFSILIIVFIILMGLIVSLLVNKYHTSKLKNDSNQQILTKSDYLDLIKNDTVSKEENNFAVNRSGSVLDDINLKSISANKLNTSYSGSSDKY